MPTRIVLATLNAKYIHASLGLRYLMANMARHGGADLAAMTSLQEFTIQRPAQQIVDALLLSLGDAGVRVLGFGVYIWNVTQTTAVVRLIKEQCPQVKVVLGGPEVSHEWQQYERQNLAGPDANGTVVGDSLISLADHLITGWGDVSFPKLCRALVQGPQPLMKVIAGEQPPLDQVDLPYDLYSATDLAQRVLYVEASRGCPFKCVFCSEPLNTGRGLRKRSPAHVVDEILEVKARHGITHFFLLDSTLTLDRRLIEGFCAELLASSRRMKSPT